MSFNDLSKSLVNLPETPEDVLCVGEDYLDPRGYKPGGIKK